MDEVRLGAVEMCSVTQDTHTALCHTVRDANTHFEEHRCNVDPSKMSTKFVFLNSHETDLFG